MPTETFGSTATGEYRYPTGTFRPNSHVHKPRSCEGRSKYPCNRHHFPPRSLQHLSHPRLRLRPVRLHWSLLRADRRYRCFRMREWCRSKACLQVQPKQSRVSSLSPSGGFEPRRASVLRHNISGIAYGARSGSRQGPCARKTQRAPPGFAGRCAWPAHRFQPLSEHTEGDFAQRPDLASGLRAARCGSTHGFRLIAATVRENPAPRQTRRSARMPSPRML